jgi:hypothetical protein
MDLGKHDAYAQRQTADRNPPSRRCAAFKRQARCAHGAGEERRRCIDAEPFKRIVVLAEALMAERILPIAVSGHTCFHANAETYVASSGSWHRIGSWTDFRPISRGPVLFVRSAQRGSHHGWPE